MTIEEAAEAVGVELLPWQREAAERIMRGDRMVIMHGGKQAGRRTFKRILDYWNEANA